MKLPLRGRITSRNCRQPKLPSFLYSSNTTSWRLMRRASNNNNNNVREEVLIPRVEIVRQDEQIIEWYRHQFQFRPAFAMIVNKVQGLIPKSVGVWLEESTFTHGQLYLLYLYLGDNGRRPSTCSLCSKQ